MPMLPEIEQLLVIQDRDRKARVLRTELKLAPTQRKDLEDKRAAAAKAFDQAKLTAKEIEVARKNLEITAESKRTQIAKYQTQKLQTRKNEEYQAISAEIAKMEADVSRIEDEELVLMEKAEAQKPLIVAADQAAAEARAVVERQIADLDTKVQALSDQLATLDAERAKLVGEVEEDLLDTYERLFKTKADRAVVALEAEICTGCHTKVTPSTIGKVRAQREVAHCENCGRILYRGDV